MPRMRRRSAHATARRLGWWNETREHEAKERELEQGSKLKPSPRATRLCFLSADVHEKVNE